jgi:DNA invertase Pin-like site-specific DNA recombinase
MASYAYIGTNADQSWQLDTVVSIYKKSMGEVELIIETSCWQKLDELMQCMSAGDVLQISNLSQLAGTAIRVMDRLTELIGMGVTVLSVEEGGAIDPNLLLYMRTLAAETLPGNCPSGEPLGERRQRKGRPTGSRLDIHATEIQQLLGEGISNSSIARRFNVSRQSFKDFAISRGLIM